MTQSNGDDDIKAYEPDDIDDLVVWTFPCADCGEVGCPYMYGEDRTELEERLRSLVKQHELDARIDELEENMSWQFTSEADIFKYIEWQLARHTELKKEREAL